MKKRTNIIWAWIPCGCRLFFVAERIHIDAFPSSMGTTAISASIFSDLNPLKDLTTPFFCGDIQTNVLPDLGLSELDETVFNGNQY